VHIGNLAACYLAVANTDMFNGGKLDNKSHPWFANTKKSLEKVFRQVY
jgi:hypothetical protein